MAKLTLPRGIRTRGERFFVDVTVNGTRKTATCSSLADAVAKKQELTDALTTGRDPSSPRSNARVWTLQEALDKTLALPAPDGWRGSSAEKAATINAQSALNFMGPQRKLDTIDRDLIDAWLNSCEAAGNSSATVNRKLSALSKIMRVAVEYEGLSVMPRMPKLRKERVGRIRSISEQEEESLAAWFAAVGDEDMADAVAVLIDTGMRRSELLNLRPVDVDLTTGVAMIYGVEDKGTKNGKFRSVPLTQRVKTILSRRTTGYRCFDMKETHMRHAWDNARAHMGLTDDRDFVLHACRHTCASRLVRAGVSLPVVMQWLGHSNITTTMRYAHLYPTDLMRAVKALEGES